MILINLVLPTHEALHKPAPPVQDINDVIPYIAPMRAIMIDHHGVGLAAPQVGLSSRFFVSLIEGHRVMINPEIKQFLGNRIVRLEGCLTWPGKYKYVPRHSIIVVEYTNQTGNRITVELNGLHARIVQHEVDHLNGICLY